MNPIKNKILLMTKNIENRRLIKKLLQEKYQVIIPKADEDLLTKSFDLILVDEYILKNYEDILREIKNNEKPVFLPILLLSSQNKNDVIYKQLQTIVTDLIITPVSKILLKTRIKNLLHIRKLSLQSDHRYHALSEKSPVGICVLQNQKIVYSNQEFINICGIQARDIIGVSFLKFVHKKDKDKVKGLFINNPNNRSVEIRLLINNHLHWVKFNSTEIIYKDKKSLLITSLDITENVDSEKRIKYLNYHDKLTGLYNRNYFEEELARLNTERQLPLSIIVCDVNGLKLVNDAFGHQTGDLLLKKIANVIQKPCRKEDIIARWGGDEFVILLPQTPYEIGENICNRIKDACSKAQNKPIKLSVAMGVATKINSEIKINDTIKKAEDRMYKNKLAHNESTRNSIIASLENTLLEKSHETNDHAERMNKLAIEFAKILGLPTNQIDELKLLSKLHDIGKVSISEKILKKTTKLTDKEFEEIKGHPESGYRIIKAVPELAPVAESILAHHERWDGTGYPRGLAKEEIPYIARIISIIDSFDVMTHARSYKKAFSKEKAIAEIERCAGSQFDPKLAKAFIEMIKG